MAETIFDPVFKKYEAQLDNREKGVSFYWAP